MIETNGWAVKLFIGENLSILTYKIYKYIINMWTLIFKIEPG